MEISVWRGFETFKQPNTEILVFVYMTFIVDNVFRMFPMRGIFCLTCDNHNISQKGQGIVSYTEDNVLFKIEW